MRGNRCSWPPAPPRRPPWWPAQEAWPPSAGAQPAWRHMRGRIFRRAALLLATLSVVATATLAVVAWLAAAIARGAPGGGPVRVFAAPLVLAVFVPALIFLARHLGGMARPAGDVMEAAGRLANGDYAVRVRERGPFELRRLARAFNDMAERLEAHEQQRRHLLAEVTHEIRTPLAVIQGNLEGILDGVYPRDDAHLQLVLEESRFLSALVEDLRTLALAETGQLALHREPADISVLVGETVASFKPRAESAQVALRVEAAGELPAVDLDPVRVRQVLTVLLTNALHHTPAGGEIRVSAEPAVHEGRAAVTISVADSGRGIAPADLPHVFDRFYKSEDSRGSGLGLAIARNLVALHEGRIAVASTPGGGTTFHVTVPAQKSGS